MGHTDPYRLTPSDSRNGAAAGINRAKVAHSLLWLILVISVIGNTVASYSNAGIGVHLALGGVTALCGTVLAVRHLRSRR